MMSLASNTGTRSRLTAGLFLAAALAGANPQHAGAMQIDGDAAALTVVLEGEARPQVVSELAARLGFRVVGSVVEDGTVSGRFRGDLAKVLGSVLTQNGFVIVYEGGRPSRLLLSAKDPAGSAAAMPSASRSLLPGGYNPGDPSDPNFAAQDPGMMVNPEGGEYIPDPTEVPVETPPQLEMQQGVTQ
jgi:hypothetical protein